MEEGSSGIKSGKEKKREEESGFGIADCGMKSSDFGLRTSDFGE
jgi:hypothetical protein